MRFRQPTTAAASLQRLVTRLNDTAELCEGQHIWAGSRALSLLLPVVLPDVRPVEHILSPFVGFHDEGTGDSAKQEKQSYFDNHFEPPAIGGSYRFWQELRSVQATY
jgi:hypothetical protein